jgi:MurNAc alpha-1-phosphate uridylyltransferase
MPVTHAIVLSAGLGTRMRPLTLTTPKPLVQVAGQALLGRHLDALQAAGITHPVVNTHYLAEQLHAFLAQRGDAALRISHEEELLETGGGITKALPLLGDGPFLAVNSDALCIDPAHELPQKLEAALTPQRDAVLVLVPRERASGYDGAGDFFFDDGVLRRRGDAAQAPYVFTGMQLLRPELFAEVPQGAFSMNVIYNRLLPQGRMSAVVHDGDWLHIGDMQGLQQAEAYFNG